MTTETRQLSLHPLAIHTFIKAQAGSLAKALSEAVMNSLDAFSANVCIQINSRGFVIEDDGQGFRSRTEIAAWFETLGFPHDEGNHRLYGKFGMGRAQMWAFARTTWVSNQFEMDVDVKKRGLNYELREAAKPHKGTRIEATFYEPLSATDIERNQLEVSNLVRYVPGLVTLNGKVVNKDPSTEVWDFETDQAFMRVDPKAHSLDVYNAGMLVAHFPRYRFGCTGVVVTKPEHTLALNLARNDILESECKVWPLISAALPKADGKKASAAPARKKTNPSDLATYRERVKNGTMTIEQALKAAPELLTTVYGRALPLRSLTWSWANQPVVVVPKGDEFGKRLSKLKLAETLSRESFQAWGLSLEELRALVRKQGENQGGYWQANFDKRLWTEDPQGHFKDLANQREIRVFKDLAPQAKADLTALRRVMATVFSSCAQQAFGPDTGAALSRSMGTIQLGDAPDDACWVDAAAGCLVLREKDFVEAFSKAMPVTVQYVLAQVHGFLAACVDDGGADQKFIELLTQSKIAGGIALNLSIQLSRERKREDLGTAMATLEAAAFLEQAAGSAWVLADDTAGFDTESLAKAGAVDEEDPDSAYAAAFTVLAESEVSAALLASSAVAKPEAAMA